MISSQAQHQFSRPLNAPIHPPSASRPNAILGGPEHLPDETGERIKEDFLTFLQRCRDQGNGNVGILSSIPTSEMLTTSNGSAVGSNYLFPSEPPTLQGVDSSQMMIGTNQQLAMPIYVQQLHEMRNEGQSTLYIDFAHLMAYNDVLATAILDNFYRFEPFLKTALKSFVEAYIPSYAKINVSNLDRDFWIAFYNVAGMSTPFKMRELNTSKIGQLLTVTGTITRTSEIRPELLLGTFRCNLCLGLYRDVLQQFQYTEPPQCSNPHCLNTNDWTLLPERSYFVNWQRIRVQECAEEIPSGSMPRCMDVIVRNEMVDRAKAGDKCTFTGTLIVIPDITSLALPGNKLEKGIEAGRSRSMMANGDGVTGLKALGVRDLTYRLAFLACMVQSTSTLGSNRSTSALRAAMDPEDELLLLESDDSSSGSLDPRIIFTTSELDEIARMRNTPQLYARLVDSIAPNIYGHAEIKAGILLMLFGGVHKVTPEGINLRGDINVCIVGDPGTAKSQFLRYVIGFLPRSVYTSGKSSSAAGLTASVVKDEETGDFTIEAGALMLADNGICAIDEFDKMDLADQVAIHEAMEQQTISISKAGIQATLNARTSILAAANPINGRYDRRRTLRQNIAMSAPIMSRFDLFFVIVDEGDVQADMNIAMHVLSLHQQAIEKKKEAAIDGGEERGDEHQGGVSLTFAGAQFTGEQLQRYIRYARTIKPKMTRESADLLVSRYTQLRQSDATGMGSSYRMTVRQLESMIRLSEALARLHLDDQIIPEYVREASRLLQASIIRVEADSIDLDAGDRALYQAADVLDDHARLRQSTSLEDDADEGSCVVGSSGKMTVKYDEYVRISNMLVYHLRHHAPSASNVERRQHKETMFANANDQQRLGDSTALTLLQGLPKHELIEWYLEQIEGDIDSEVTLNLKHRQVSAIIDRLVYKDGILIELPPIADGEKFIVGGGDEEENATPRDAMDDTEMINNESAQATSLGVVGDKSILVVHPNYVIA